ncbi:2025_t:CDS:2 [Dentiscutata erythropus]|uniref:2025_t:CDS:1 n=1 Tax=Dentiscutata erythropus TaxID=1348616 RepID=A0A9N9JYY4_9GLOM|nr:2025_t:CDS:2 [Dentiscutata erythropus]
MESEYRLLLSNYSLTCDLEEKYLVTLSHLTLVEKYGIPVKETKNAIETQLVIQSNLKKKYKEMITSYEIDSREFSLIVLITSKKQILISKRINSNKDYFGYYHVECAIREMKEETKITIKELFYFGINERFRVFPDGKECLCRCAVYYTYIDDQIPIRTEPDKHDDWIFKHQLKKT